MPRTHVPLSAGGRATRTDLGGKAAEVKHHHVLKCFERSNAMTLVARIIEFALGKARVADLRQARQELAPSRLMNEIKPAPRPGIPVECVCTGPVGPRE
jgi:hypothetical protein